MRSGNARGKRRLRWQSVCAEALEGRRLLTTYYVDANAPAGTPDGVGWNTAYPDLQQALSVAVSGDEIHVADGTYKPTSTTNVSISFQLKTGVALYGGYAGYGAADPDARDYANNPSILSGEINNNSNLNGNSTHVVNGSGVTSTAVLDGFTVTAGYANSTATNGGNGGGLLVTSGSPTIQNCLFANNQAAASYGGAISISSSPGPTVINSVFETNAAIVGGAVAVFASASTFISCTFTQNSASTSYGAVYATSTATKLMNCIAWNNPGAHIPQVGPSASVTYSDIQGGFTGAGNLNADPLFVRVPSPGPDGQFGFTYDDDLGDLHISPASPLADAGNNSAVPAGVALDASGAPRFADIVTTTDTGVGTAPIVDMGAYEATGSLDCQCRQRICRASRRQPHAFRARRQHRRRAAELCMGMDRRRTV